MNYAGLLGIIRNSYELIRIIMDYTGIPRNHKGGLMALLDKFRAGSSPTSTS